MNTPTIDVEITEAGEVRAAVNGVAGPACGELSAFLDQLGAVVEDSPTPDFYQAVAADDQVRLGWESGG